MILKKTTRESQKPDPPALLLFRSGAARGGSPSAASICTPLPACRIGSFFALPQLLPRSRRQAYRFGRRNEREDFCAHCGDESSPERRSASLAGSFSKGGSRRCSMEWIPGGLSRRSSGTCQRGPCCRCRRSNFRCSDSAGSADSPGAGSAPPWGPRPR